MRDVRTPGRSRLRERVLLVRIAHPGAIPTLHNYPRFLQELHKPDENVVDLAAIDVLRIP